MNSKLNFIITGATAAMFLLPMKTDAQKLEMGLKNPIPASVLETARKATPAQEMKQEMKVKAQYPMLFQHKFLQKMNKTGLRNVIANKKIKAPLALEPRVPMRAAAATGRELWGSLLNDNTWDSSNPQYGVYSFKAEQNIGVEAIGLNESIVPNGGGAIVGDRADFVNYFSFFGMIFVSHYAFNTDSWEQIGETTSPGIEMIATETAVAADGTVYGVFYNTEGSGLELGIADYENDTRTTIGSLSRTYVALGITADNKLYGISTDGNLYSIDTETAAETLIGATGVVVSDDEGAYYQSGEIDQKTNVFYWASVDVTTNIPALYKVDLSTGAAEMIGEFTNDNIVSVLTVPTAIADGAPAAATDMAADFKDGSLSGTVSFTIPTKTANGEDLTGEVTYTIANAKEVLKTGKAAPGAAVSEPITFTEDGNKRLNVTLANEAGNSAKAKVNIYVGYDIPKAVTDLTLNVDEATGEAKLAWAPVTEGMNDGYMGDITYDVVRYPGEVTVAKGIKDTSFSDKLPQGVVTAYSYGVKANNGEKVSEESTTDYKLYGDPITPPYAEDFTNPSSINYFTIIDNNGDERSWARSTDSAGNSFARYTYSGQNNGDDWLITPPLKVEKGRVYAVSFRAGAYLGSMMPERIEVKYGYDKTAEAMTGELLPATDLTTDGLMEFSKEITAKEDGTLYLGFHAISDADMYYLDVDDITVEAGMAANAPDKVSDFTVTPGEKGAEKATISFTAPTKGIDGSTLSGNVTLKVTRDGSVIKEFKDAAPGSQQSFVDETPAAGFNTYRVEVSDASGAGRSSEKIKVFVGIDKASDPINLTAADKQTSVGITWQDSEEGANGGYVDTSKLSHKVYDLVDGTYGLTAGDSYDVPAGTNSYDFPYVTTEGDQDLKRFGVSAVSGEDETSISITPVVITGKPYGIPFTESVTGGSLSNGLWWLSSSGSSSYGLGEDASDDDGGCFGYQSKGDDDTALISSGKIDLAGATNPMLIFSYKATAAGNGKIVVTVQKPDGTRDVIKTIDATQSASKWTREAISLSSEYTSLPYVMVQFTSSANEGELIYLDEIYVRDIYENDLTLSGITAPEKVKKGEKANIEVEVTNFGSEVVAPIDSNSGDKAYSVKLYAGDKLIETKDETACLNPFEKRTYKFEMPTNVMMEGSSIEIKAEVEYADDLNPDDNAASTTLEFAIANKPRPENAKYTVKSDGSVKVDWDAVTETSIPVTDGFEEYEGWTQDNFGEWTSVSVGDKCTTGGLFSNYPYPGQGDSFAFTVVEPLNNWISQSTLENNPSLIPHSGNKYIGSFYSYEGENFLDANDWLISPTLSGKKQTVTFWLSNNNVSDTAYPETYDILYSTGGTDVSEFKKIGETRTASSGAWEEVSVEIPEGATHFAINRNTPNASAFLFMIDDVSYETGSGAVSGYNVYRDGEIIKFIPAGTETFTDETAEASKKYVYAITAVFADGAESEATVATDVTSGIENVENLIKATSYDVYTIDGKLVGSGMKSLKDLKSGSYIVNNQKVVIK